MKNYLHIKLPREDVVEWHKDCCGKANSAVDTCKSAVLRLQEEWRARTIDDLSANDLLRELLQGESTCQLFGIPTGWEFRIPVRENCEFTGDERTRWGRRVFHHARALRRGLECQQNLANTIAALEALEWIHSLENKINDAFESWCPSLEKFMNVMGCPDAGHAEFAQFHSSRIEPVLYSSLRYINKPGLQRRRGILDFLYGNLRTSLDQLQRKNRPHYSDDALLWWAQYELVRIHQADKPIEYSVGKQTGLEGAAQVCKELIDSWNKGQVTPVRRIAAHEMPPDIYNCARSRLVIVLNAIKIASMMPESCNPDLPGMLTQFINKHLGDLMHESFQSMYHIGLALQVASATVKYCREFLVASDNGVDKVRNGAWYVGNNRFEVYRLGQTYPLVVEVSKTAAKIIVALIDLGGETSVKELVEKSGVNDPVTPLRRIVEGVSKNKERSEKLKALGNYIATPKVKCMPVKTEIRIEKDQE